MAGSIIIPILTGFDSKGIKDAESALASLGGKIKSFGRSAAAAIGSYAVGAQAINFVQSSATAAMELQRNMTGVSSIFGELTPQIQGYINASEQLGMSHAQAAKAVTFLGSVFKQTGMPMDQVIEKTKTMVNLGADLAATYGYSVEEALTAMTATFRGEYDPIEKFGVAMKQQQVNAILADRGLKGLTGSALIAAQQQVRYEMILQRTTDSQGAFARSSNNLFQQQQILNAEFTDLKATLGMALIPAMVKMAEAIKPILSDLAPKLAEIFVVIANVLIQLTPLLPKLADVAVQAFGVLATVIKTVSPFIIGLIDFMASNTPLIVGFFAAFTSAKILAVVVPAIQALRVQFALLKLELRDATLAQVLFNGATMATPWGAIAASIGLIATAWAYNTEWVNKYNKAQSGIAGLSAAAQAQAKAYAERVSAKIGGAVAGMKEAAYANALQEWYARYQSKHAADTNTSIDANWAKVQKKLDALFKDTPSLTSNSAKVATWFDNLAVEVEKQSDRIKLAGKGLSAALIDSVLNASDWKTAVAKIIGMTSSDLKKLQKDFAGTSAGQAEAEKAAADLAERTTKFVDAVQARIETIKSLTKDLGGFLPKTLTQINTQMGQFESDVVSAGETLRNSLASALDSKSITDSAYVSLLTYANKEIAVLQKLAAQRDVLAKKIEAAKQVYIEVAQAVRGYGNITSTTTAQVTESYKKIIDGVEVTVTRTVEALQNNDLVGTYKSVVDKTKAFLANLTQLKKMGLNQTLFKQIIDAGVDAGNATAEAIVAGGGETVSSLNDLFGQLDATGAQMADLTAQVMQDSGITIVSGFIDGLTAQEAELTDKAKALAEAFSTAFNKNVNLVVPKINPTDYGLTTSQANAALTVAGINVDQTPKVAPTVPTVPTIPTVDTPVIVSKGDLDRLERAAAGIGNLAGINTAEVVPAGPDRVERMAAAYAAANPTYNVTVNAGMGTDGATVGQTIVQLLKQYERNNGAVWTAAS